jgi:hypothetical protein
MWRYNSKTIQEGRAWIGEDGIQNSPQWHLWTVEEKEAAGLEEFIPDSPPDSRLYTWSQNADGTIDSMTKALDDALMVSSEGTPVLDEDGNQRVAVGVKSQLISEVKAKQGRLLSETDWAVIRRADVDTEVPDNIQTWRNAIRAKADEMEAAIDGAANTAAVAALFEAGTLSDWPEEPEL